jgi:PAS domain S-box-containing protein
VGSVVLPFMLVAFSRALQAETRSLLALNQMLIDQLPANVYARDLAGRFTFVNKAYARTHGVAAADIQGRTPEAVWPDGFGSRLVHRTVSMQLGGTIKYEWSREGLVVTLSLQRAKLLA